MMDIYEDPMLNVNDTSLYLDMPSSTLGVWKKENLIHSVTAKRGGWPTLPFVAVVEAFVLRSLRELGFTRRQITEAADGIRREFGDEYGLARPGIGHDEGAEIFIEIDEQLYRAKDRQQAIRDTVANFQSCIQWKGEDPARLKLAKIGNVYLDPRFAWGQPTVGPNSVPVQSVIGLWHAGEPLSVIADEYDMSENDVDRLVRSWSRLRDRQLAA